MGPNDFFFFHVVPYHQYCGQNISLLVQIFFVSKKLFLYSFFLCGHHNDHSAVVNFDYKWFKVPMNTTLLIQDVEPMKILNDFIKYFEMKFKRNTSISKIIHSPRSLWKCSDLFDEAVTHFLFYVVVVLKGKFRRIVELEAIVEVVCVVEIRKVVVGRMDES